MDFNRVALNEKKKSEGPLDTFHRLTGDSRWQEDTFVMPHQKAFTLEFEPGDRHAEAFMQACYAIGTTELELPRQCQYDNPDEQTVETTAAFRLPLKLLFSERFREHGIDLRVTATHQKITSYDNAGQVEEKIFLRCVCDVMGNIFRLNEDAFIAAYQEKLNAPAVRSDNSLFPGLPALSITG